MRVEILLICLGVLFQSEGPNTANDESKSVLDFIELFTFNGGILATVPNLMFMSNNIARSLLILLFKIFIELNWFFIAGEQVKTKIGKGVTITKNSKEKN